MNNTQTNANINAKKREQYHPRKQIRLTGYDYSLPGYYFVTVCTQERKNILGKIVNEEMKLNKYGEIVNKVIQFLSRQYPSVNLDIYQIMPNHIHMIIVIAPVGAIHESPDIIDNNKRAHPDAPLQSMKRSLLSKCVGYFKMNTAKQINQLRNTPQQSVWQRGFYEHIIRNETELVKIQEYINLNPLMWLKDEDNLERKNTHHGH